MKDGRMVVWEIRGRHSPTPTRPWASSVVASLPQRVAQPFKTLVKSIPRGSASRLDVLQSVLAYSMKVVDSKEGLPRRAASSYEDQVCP